MSESTTATEDLLRTLVDLESRGWDALCAGAGADFYGRLMTEDGVMLVADGSVLDRDAVVASLRDPTPWSSYSIDDPRLVAIGADGVALVYRGTGVRDGEPLYVAGMTTVYVRHPGGWRVAFHQQTPVAST